MNAPTSSRALVLPVHRLRPPGGGRAGKRLCLVALAALGLPGAGWCAPAANTADGTDALGSVTTGDFNSAFGDSSLLSLTTGSDNTGVGAQALYNNSADASTALGFQAMYSNTSGTGNTATGCQSLYSNTTGYSNTAAGYDALYASAAGMLNVADGFEALYADTSGCHNVAVGANAMSGTTSGSYNTAVGFEAGQNTTTGNDNIALGQSAGSKVTIGSYNIDIGHAGGSGDTATIHLGTEGTQKNAFMAGVSGVTVASGVPVVIDTNGHLGTKTSSERFKEGIAPMDKASEAILQLEPVSFRYKPEYDPEGAAQFGLVAEQVAKVDPDLVARDADGKVYTVRYDEVNAMLLNEFLKEHRQVAAQQDTIAQLRADLETQHKELQDLAALVRAQASR